MPRLIAALSLMLSMPQARAEEKADGSGPRLQVGDEQQVGPGHYVWAGVDDLGGWISLTSTGWQGDTFETTMQDANGQWMPPNTESCKKK